MPSQLTQRWIFPLVFALIAVASATAQSERKVTQLSDGVYVIEHRAAIDGNQSGNTSVIIGERQVLVVDTCFLPSDAEADIAQIRQWTGKPVSFVLNTHFHNDHNLGNAAYMKSFPAITIIAHVETKKEMDRFGPGSAGREQKSLESLQKMLATGKASHGRVLTAEEKTQVQEALTQQQKVIEELKPMKFQSATLTFDHDFTIDLGGREVQIKFLGRGNTPGDAVAYLPKEKIVVAGDLVVYPMPYLYDGYPSEWSQTLQNLASLESVAIVPGHGPILRDKSYVYLLRDLLQSAVDQLNAKLSQSGPAMFSSMDELKDAVNLENFRQRFVGTDKGLNPAFDEMTKSLIQLAFREASLR